MTPTVVARRFGGRLALAFALLATLLALVTAFYLAEARRHVGADYTAMVTDVVRAQDDTYTLRMTLDSLRDTPHGHHLDQLEERLTLIARRIDGIRHLLERSDVPLSGYAPMLEALDLAEARLPDMEREIRARSEAGEGEDLDTLLTLGAEVEEELAWAYSELNELLHAASAEQRRMMERLSLAVILLVGLLLLVVGALMLALLRILQQRETLRHQSETDALTGLANRRKIYAAAEQELARGRRGEGPLGLVLIDLDHFKEINDRFGHPTGDAVLKAFARTLRDAVREVDYPVRMGGEEFAILMPDTDLAGATRLAERIRAATEALALPGRARDHTLTASLGVTASDEATEHFDQLFSRADQLLYLAKSRGRNHVAWG
jgi:diguanylate cyclase